MYDEFGDFLPGGNVDGEYNPYTGERIASLNSSSWGEATAQDLYKQLNVLENRYYIALTLGKVEIAKQLQMAVASLKSAITEAINRDAKRPIRKRPNTPEQRPDIRRSSSSFE